MRADPVHSIALLNDPMKARVMSRAGPKQVLYEQFAEVAKALGHGHRLEILELLAQREQSVEALAERAGLSIANASQHLRLMRRAGLLASRRDGKHVFYRLSELLGARSWGGVAAGRGAEPRDRARSRWRVFSRA